MYINNWPVYIKLLWKQTLHIYEILWFIITKYLKIQKLVNWLPYVRDKEASVLNIVKLGSMGTTESSLKPSKMLNLCFLWFDTVIQNKIRIIHQI